MFDWLLINLHDLKMQSILYEINLMHKYYLKTIKILNPKVFF